MHERVYYYGASGSYGAIIMQDILGDRTEKQKESERQRDRALGRIL